MRVMPRSIEYAFSQIHPKRRSKLLKLMNEHSVHASDYEHRVYRCEQCGQLRNAFWIKLVYDEGKIYETTCLCAKCHEGMVNLSDYHQLNNKSCPCCGEKKLHVIEDFFWDEMSLMGWTSGQSIGP